MQEFEAKFTGFTLESARNLLIKHGYACQKPECTMVRKTFHIQGNNNKWGRVRDEGDKITLTIKEITQDNNISGMKEAEVVINNFESGVQVLEMSGFYESSTQETKREIWHKKGVDVMIDTWPGINPFIEVESTSPEAVETACQELGLNMEKALFGAVGLVYLQELGIPEDKINKMQNITFKNPPQKIS